LADNGYKWLGLPHGFPPYATVANFYYAAIKSGHWEKLSAALVEKYVLPLDEKQNQTTFLPFGTQAAWPPARSNT